MCVLQRQRPAGKRPNLSSYRYFLQRRCKQKKKTLTIKEFCIVKMKLINILKYANQFWKRRRFYKLKCIYFPIIKIFPCLLSQTPAKPMDLRFTFNCCLNQNLIECNFLIRFINNNILSQILRNCFIWNLLFFR